MPDGDMLQQRLDQLRARYPAGDPEMMAEVVRAVLSSLGGDLTGREARLLSEVEELGRTIAAAKAEIAALRVDDITHSHIPSATDELDAIVAHTAAATESILECCETLDSVAAGLEGAGAQSLQQSLQEATTRIYEACSFQDITGQRITKVVAALKAIESKVALMLAAFEAGEDLPPPPPPPPEAALLNGPQLPASAMDQSDIDRLLASFD